MAEVERPPDNLAFLYDKFGKAAIDGILPGDSFEVDGVTFVSQYLHESTADRFYIVKPMSLVARYDDLCEEFEGGVIVELGIAEGGSTALLALRARPRSLVAVDLEPVPLGALAEFVTARGLGDSVHTVYGMDQSDRVGLAAAVDRHTDGEPIDLVIDDCSHSLDPTRSSFETLFPRMRPGGLYVIEDWASDQIMFDAVAATLRDPTRPEHEAAVEQFRASMQGGAGPVPDGHRPMLQLAVELVLARASLGDAIAEVAVDCDWIKIRRGHDPLDPASFRLRDAFSDYFRFLPPAS